jgi:uncharacterized membrane protein
MSPRHRRRDRSRRAESVRVPEWTEEEIARLTQRADELLADLHEVLDEMSGHLQSVARGGGDDQ